MKCKPTTTFRLLEKMPRKTNDIKLRQIFNFSNVELYVDQSKNYIDQQIHT